MGEDRESASGAGSSTHSQTGEGGGKRGKRQRKRQTKQATKQAKTAEEATFQEAVAEAEAMNRKDGESQVVPKAANKGQTSASKVIPTISKDKEKGKEKDKSTGKEKETSGTSAASTAAAASSAAKPNPADAKLAEGLEEKVDENRRPRKAMDLQASTLSKTKKNKNQIFTEDQNKLMSLVIKVVLSLCQNDREFQGALFDVFLLPVNLSLVLTLVRQGRRYAHAVQEDGHGLGPPYLYAFGALVHWILEQSFAENADSQNWQQYSGMLISQRLEVVRMCKLAKLFRSDQRKLVLAFGSGGEAQMLRRRILDVLCKIPNVEYKQGRPPAGHMERVLSQWVQELVA